jgi:hypothetical protein
MPRPPHSSRFYHPNNIGSAVDYSAAQNVVSSTPPSPRPISSICGKIICNFNQCPSFFSYVKNVVNLTKLLGTQITSLNPVIIL